MAIGRTRVSPRTSEAASRIVSIVQFGVASEIAEASFHRLAMVDFSAPPKPVCIRARGDAADSSGLPTSNVFHLIFVALRHGENRS